MEKENRPGIIIVAAVVVGHVFVAVLRSGTVWE